LAFATRPLFARIPRPVKLCLLFLLIALAAEQVAGMRHYAKAVLASSDVTQTIEYRTSIWARDNLAGVRVMLPGSIGKWANVFTTLQQFGGGSWSVAYNQVQQYASAAIYNGSDSPQQDAQISVSWLKAFGTGAIAVSGPQSQEYWKPFAHPKKFDGVLPVLWSQDDVTIYRVPLRTPSLAHVVPETALVRRAPRGPQDTKDLNRYVAALEDESLPLADFRWEGDNRIHIRAHASPGQVVSVQVSNASGWHARANAASRKIETDGLGLMWIQPGCNGPCDLDLEYDGGAALRIFRWISAAMLVAFAVFFGWRILRAAASRLRPAQGQQMGV